MEQKKKSISANLPKKSPTDGFSGFDLHSLIEFTINAGNLKTIREIANLTVLSFLGRLKLRNGYIKVKNIEIVKGKKQKNYLITRELAYGDYKIGEIGLGGEGEKIKLNLKDKEFIEGLCTIAAVLIKNLDNIKELKEANKLLSRKILQFESLFEASKELLLTPEIEKSVSICLNIISGSLGLKEAAISLSVEDKRLFQGKNLNPDDIKEKSIKKIKVKEITLYLGEKINGKKLSQAELHFAEIVLNLLYTNFENLKMIKQLIEKEKMENEILIARDIQQKLVPLSLPKIDGFSISAKMVTYNQVGGDYYDIIPVSDNSFLTVIADVSGKGIPASLIMSAVQSSIKTLVLEGKRDLKSIAEILNKLLLTTTEGNKFVSLCLLFIERDKEKITYLNAGHTPPLLFKQNGEIHKLKSGGPVIGLLDFAKYSEKEIEFKKGEFVFLYTDGVSECTDIDGNEFKEINIIEFLKNNADKPDFPKLFLEKLRNFSQNNFNDDVTFILIKNIL